MGYIAVKNFEVQEESTENMWYKITVIFNGKVVEEFSRPTMHEAHRDLELAGYKKINTQ